MASAIPQDPLLCIIGATGTGKSKVTPTHLIVSSVYLLLQLAGG
jgi:hypothetical protein